MSRNEKNVLKSAQTIWATNKYFVLACSQRDYQLVRELLKPDILDLGSVYDVLKRIIAQLPQKICPKLQMPSIIWVDISKQN